MKIIAKSILIISIVLFTSIGFLRAEGFRINITNSYPQGLYEITNAPIQKGSLVIFCPAENDYFKIALERGYISPGYCSGGYGYMIKKVIAAKIDKVQISESGVYVNDKLVPNSIPLKRDKSGRDLVMSKVQDYIINDNSVLLMSDYSPNSYDGRYFGLVDKSNIISSIRPIITW